MAVIGDPFPAAKSAARAGANRPLMRP